MKKSWSFMLWSAYYDKMAYLNFLKCFSNSGHSMISDFVRVEFFGMFLHVAVIWERFLTFRTIFNILVTDLFVASSVQKFQSLYPRDFRLCQGGYLWHVSSNFSYLRMFFDINITEFVNTYWLYGIDISPEKGPCFSFFNHINNYWENTTKSTSCAKGFAQSADPRNLNLKKCES